MKTTIHPNYGQTPVVCACGNQFHVGSTLVSSGNIKVEVCSKCHPFYTGKRNLIDTAGRVDMFKKRSEAAAQKQAAAQAAADKKEKKKADEADL